MTAEFTNTTIQKTNLEWPTWLLIVFVYGTWLLLINTFYQLPLVIAVPALTLTLTLHSSLCHELIHGHPTKIQWLNNLIGYPPITLIYPYTIFKESHLKHHNNQDITCPGIDPESFYCTDKQWRNKGKLARLFAWVNMTLLGRMLFGPGYCFLALGRAALNDIVSGNIRRRLMWLLHYALIASIVYLMHSAFNIPAWLYMLMAYFSLSLIQLRSFYEHQPNENASARSVIQEASLPMRLLYLNNNYHHVHHKFPKMPWYQLKAQYLSHQADYLKANQHFHYRGYGQWLRYLFKPVDSPIHPFYPK